MAPKIARPFCCGLAAVGGNLDGSMATRRCRTRNTEYELVDDVCVAVRDLATGRPVAAHRALGQRLHACVGLSAEGALSAASGPLRRGVCLWFRAPGHDVLTTPVLEVRS